MRTASLLQWRLPIFGVLALLIVGAEWFVVHSVAFTQHSLLPVAILLDLTVVLPLVFFVLIARPMHRPWQSTLSVVAVGAAVAASLLGDHGTARLLARAVGGLAEVLLLGIAVSALRRAAQTFAKTAPDQADILLRLDSLSVSPSLKLVAAELAIFYYAFVGPRLPTPRSERHFSYTEKSTLGGLLFAFGFLTVAEGLVVHVLLRQWSVAAASLFTALHVYTLLWLVALHQATRLRPHVLTPDGLLVRVSLLWTVLVPYGQIAEITAQKTLPECKDPALLRTIPGLEPEFLLTLHTPLEARGPLGRCRSVTQLALAVDESARFLDGLRTAMEGNAL